MDLGNSKASEVSGFVDVFAKLPEDIFKPLAAEGRRFYAALLIHLYDRVFSTVGVIPRKPHVVAEIADYIEFYGKAKGSGSVSVPADFEPTQAERREMAKQDETADVRRYMTYNYLARCGWFIEIKDKFRRMVDMSPEGRLIIREIQKIAAGDVRSYGGAVLSVLSSIQSAIDYPDEHSEALNNACEHALNFNHHLRTIATRMRQAEEHVCSQKGTGNIIRVFFEDFISEFIIQDFKTLHTRNNPFRFRTRILEKIVHIRSDSNLLARLARGYVREGRADTAAGAETAIHGGLEDIYRVFNNIDDQLSIIDETHGRIHTRVQTTVRYMDRQIDSVVDHLARACKALAESPLADHDIVDVPSRVVMTPALIGPDTMFRPKKEKRPIGRTRLREMQEDPGMKAYREAKGLHGKRMAVTIARMRGYAERVLNGRAGIRASEIEISNVDDFISFQKLREIAIMFDGVLAKEFSVVNLGKQAENEWLIFEDFTLSNVRSKRGRHG